MVLSGAPRESGIVPHLSSVNCLHPQSLQPCEVASSQDLGAGVSVSLRCH